MSHELVSGRMEEVVGKAIVVVYEYFNTAEIWHFILFLFD